MAKVEQMKRINPRSRFFRVLLADEDISEDLKYNSPDILFFWEGYFFQSTGRGLQGDVEEVLATRLNIFMKICGLIKRYYALHFRGILPMLNKHHLHLVKDDGLSYLIAEDDSADWPGAPIYETGTFSHEQAGQHSGVQGSGTYDWTQTQNPIPYQGDGPTDDEAGYQSFFEYTEDESPDYDPDQLEYEPDQDQYGFSEHDEKKEDLDAGHTLVSIYDEPTTFARNPVTRKRKIVRRKNFFNVFDHRPKVKRGELPTIESLMPNIAPDDDEEEEDKEDGCELLPSVHSYVRTDKMNYVFLNRVNETITDIRREICNNPYKRVIDFEIAYQWVMNKYIWYVALWYACIEGKVILKTKNLDIEIFKNNRSKARGRLYRFFPEEMKATD
jgi:hypothetical protein